MKNEPGVLGIQRINSHFRVRVFIRLLAVVGTVISFNAPRLCKWVLFRILKHKKNEQRIIGESIALTAERLGPFYLKAAQMISHRSDFFSESTLEPLRRIQNNVRPEPFERSKQTVEQAFDSKLWKLFSRFDPVPLAAGSIATVYSAEKLDGSRVAVKVVRHDVSSVLEADLSIGRWFVTLARKLPSLKGIPVLECYNETRKLFANQLDMTLEASNLRVLRTDKFIQNHLKSPHPDNDLEHRDVLVMEFIENSRCLSDKEISDEDYRQFSRSMLLVLYRMVFELGAVHCDMHPGNVLVDSGGKAWLVDAGFFAILNARDRYCFRDIFLGLAYAETSRLLDGIVSSAVSVPSDLDRTALSQDVMCIVSQHSGKSAGSFLVATFVLDLFKVQKRYKLYARSNLVAAIWAFVTFEGIVRGHTPNLDFQREARPFVVSEIIGSMRTR